MCLNDYCTKKIQTYDSLNVTAIRYENVRMWHIFIVSSAKILVIIFIIISLKINKDCVQI